MRHRSFIAASGAVASAALAPTASVQAQGAKDFPNKPITLIMPWPAGSGVDVAMRAGRGVASKTLGQPVVVDNKRRRLGHARAGQRWPYRQARRLHDRADADHPPAPAGDAEDHVRSAEGLHLDPAQLSGLHVRRGDARPIAPFKTFQDVIEFAKANPGKVTYATPGAGTLVAHRHGDDRRSRSA